MSLASKLNKLMEISGCFLSRPKASLHQWGQLPNYIRASKYAEQLRDESGQKGSSSVGLENASSNPLQDFFDARETGNGIWKWEHYFDIYHHHFKRFIGKDVNIVEIGVYSGGSLEMWRDYFGEKCKIHGVDIVDACKCYENDFTDIHIGDQADATFWDSFKKEVPYIDILIDDGGHLAEQQIVTFEETFPYIRPGGIFFCEDIQGLDHGFSSYVPGLLRNYNVLGSPGAKTTGSEPGLVSSPVQAWIKSVHLYPYVTVIEKADKPMDSMYAPKHGTVWQPHLSE